MGGRLGGGGIAMRSWRIGRGCGTSSAGRGTRWVPLSLLLFGGLRARRAIGQVGLRGAEAWRSALRRGGSFTRVNKSFAGDMMFDSL